MKKLLSLFLIILFFSCSKKNENDLPRVIVPEPENVIEVNSEEMLKLNHYPFLFANIPEFRILENTNSIIFDSSYNLDVRLRPDTILPKYNIRVIIDTLNITIAKGFQYKPIPYPKITIVDGLIDGKIPNDAQYVQHEKEYNRYFNDRSRQWENYVKCYRLLIFNKANDTILTRFKYIQEAKDKNGDWKPIECYYNFGGCGNPESYFYKLIPNNYMGYPVIKYNGDFKTKIRIKLFNAGTIYYSNEFFGYINYSQFDTSSFKEIFKKENPTYNFDEVSKFFFLSD